MNLIKCKENHIYDADKFRNCPHCSSMIIPEHMPDTFGLDQANVGTVIPGGTQQANCEKIGRRKTLGMLICTKGEMIGAGFLLKEGENDIGRASNMDIALLQEVTISRKKHATIICDLNHAVTILRVNEEKSEVYCNGKPVIEECILRDRDFLTLGECTLIYMEAMNVWKAN